MVNDKKKKAELARLKAKRHAVFIKMAQLNAQFSALNHQIETVAAASFADSAKEDNKGDS